MLAWYEIVILVLMIYWIVGTVVFFWSKENDMFAAMWTMGIIYPLLFILMLPVRLYRKHHKGDKK